MTLAAERPAERAPLATDPASVLSALAASLEGLTPQLQLAARYILDNPGEVAVTSMRGIAETAEVQPNSLVRMARAVGFDSYEDFREPFRRQAADASPSFPDRARFLQSINEGGAHGALLADMAASALGNVEALFAALDLAELKAAADLISCSRRAAVMGVGVAQPLAANFAYVASMAVNNVDAIPSSGPTGVAVDDVARLTPDDVLVAMTMSPYRTEIVDAVELAVANGVSVVAVSDSLAAPIALGARHAFVVPNDSPLPFSSNVAASALLETLLAFVVADSPTDVVGAIDRFHANRRSAGLYVDSSPAQEQP